ncbi:MAG TPA: GNAT family protein [Longimicrobium sp.]|jgi:ribosomal-protein-serine acetyltransferase
MFPFRVDSELTLALLEPRHAAELFQVTDENRAHLRRWLPWLDGVRSEDDTLAFIQGTRAQLAASNGFQCAILLDGRIAGVIGHHAIDWGNRATSLGYWLAERHQGRGAMTRSCAAFLDHAFGELGLNRLEIRCATGNERSCAIPERLGFRLEGVAREPEWLYDHFVDHRIYAILAREWRGTARPGAER